MSALQVIWFVLIGVLLTGYAVLDGFDLGVGVWHLFSRKDEDRRAQLNAIAPVWDGNEVWLLTGGGAIFAAFPHVYATVFSGFYLAMMLVLFGLILRAVSGEFRSQGDSPTWRAVWDVGFAVGSTLPALLFGVAIGNVLRGLPLDEAKNFTGSFFSLLNPYSLLLGVTGLAMFATHGATYLALRTTGDLAERARGWGRKACAAYLALLVVATGTTIVVQPHLLTNYGALPALWVVPVITLLCTVMIGVFNGRGKALQAFLASSLSIVGVMVLIAIGLFPNLVPALNDPRLSLTITNASSSELTLKVMFIVALLGMPIVLAYTAWVYYIFRGKVGAESPGY